MRRQRAPRPASASADTWLPLLNDHDEVRARYGSERRDPGTAVFFGSGARQIRDRVAVGGRFSVREIRNSFEKRNAIEDVKSVRSDDLEITKEGGEAVLTANWSVRVPMVANANACLDFMVTTAK